jgi:hypothetical protein
MNHCAQLRANARPYFSKYLHEQLELPSHHRVPSARERVTNFQLMERHADKMIKVLCAKAVDHEPVDVQDLFVRAVTDVAAEFLFGDPDFNTLDQPLRRPGSESGALGTDDYGTFLNAYIKFGLIAMVRFCNPPVVWAAKYFFNDPLAGPNAAVTAYFEPLAKKAIEMNQKRLLSQNIEEDMSFIDHLAATTDGEPSVGLSRDPKLNCMPSDPRLIRDQMLNMMLASRETVCQPLAPTRGRLFTRCNNRRPPVC